MKFFFGVAIGAVGMWAYTNGKLNGFMGRAPDSVQQAWQPAADRINQVANSDQVRQAVSTAQDGMRAAQDRVQSVQDSMRPKPEIATPTAAEVAGRPSEPLPTPEA